MAASESFFDNLPPYVKTLALVLVPALCVFALEEATRPHAVAPVAVAASPDQIDYTYTKSDMDAVKQLTVNARAMLQGLDQNLSATHPAAEFVCLNGLRYGVYSPMALNFARLNDSMSASFNMQSSEDEKYMSSNTAKLVTYTLNVIPTMEVVITSMSQGCNGNPLLLLHAAQIKNFVGQSAIALKTIQAHTQPTAKK